MTIGTTTIEGQWIYSKITTIMGELGAVEKGRRNTAQGYAFRGIDDMYSALQPLFVKHGVFVVPEVTNIIREEKASKGGSVLVYSTLTVKHTFFAAQDGSYVTATTVGEAMDSGDKSCNKAMSAAMKYALIEVFCVPTAGDNDTENTSHTIAARSDGGGVPRAVTPGDASGHVINWGKLKGTTLSSIEFRERQGLASWIDSTDTPGKALLDTREAIRRLDGV